MTKLTWAEFMEKFDECVHSQLARARETSGTSALVLFENVDMSSSRLGECTAMRVGPGCTYKDVAATEGQHLNDLPSQRQYAQAYTEDMPHVTEEVRNGS